MFKVSYEICFDIFFSSDVDQSVEDFLNALSDDSDSDNETVEKCTSWPKDTGGVLINILQFEFTDNYEMLKVST